MQARSTVNCCTRVEPRATCRLREDNLIVDNHADDGSEATSEIDVDSETHPEVVATPPGDRLRFNWWRRIVSWAAFMALSAVFLRPILIAPIIGDDFLNPWQQFANTGTSPAGIWRFAIDATTNAGHFNYLGQVVGAYISALWMWMMSDLGIRYTTMYAVTKLIVYTLTVAAVGSFVRTAAALVGRHISPWRGRIYVAIPLFGILQIHLPWSHDPVATYPLSGFASAAIGFMVMKLAIDAYRSAALRASIIAGSAGVASILYYEIEVAAIAALVPLALWAWRAHGGGRVGARKVAIPVAFTLALPTLAAAAFFLYSRANSISYGGTQVEVGSRTAGTFRIAFLGTLPGSAWNLSREFLAGPIAIRGYATAILILTATVLFTLASRFRPQPDPPPDSAGLMAGPADRRVTMLAMAAVCMSPVIYWVGATVIQSSTPKVQNEITRIGAVYNYYAVGTAAIASLVVLVILFWPPRWNVGVIRIGALATAIGFICIQYMVNWNINDRYQGYATLNRQLQAAFSDHSPMAHRCAVLVEWEAVAWPEYLEVAIVDGYQISYEHYHGEPFCEGFTRSVTG